MNQARKDRKDAPEASAGPRGTGGAAQAAGMHLQAGVGRRVGMIVTRSEGALTANKVLC